MHKIFEFVWGLLLAGFCSGLIALVLLTLYDYLRSGTQPSATGNRSIESALIKTVGIAIAIGALGYIPRFCARYFGLNL